MDGRDISAFRRVFDALRSAMTAESALELARRRQPEQRLSERLEVREVPLALLGHGVQVAEATLERVLLEDRGRARRVIGIVHNLARRMDGVAGHATGGDALLL